MVILLDFEPLLNKYLSTGGGNMMLSESITDFELYGSTSKGIIQGYR